LRIVDRDLQTILLRDNPWVVSADGLPGWLRARLPASVLPRRMADQAKARWSEIDRAHLVIGPRQAGKSTALWAYLAERGEPALFIDCEQPLVRAWCQSAPLFLADLEQLVDRPVPLFFEEVQHLEEAGLFLKGLVDRRIGVPILVTGSSSYHLGARTRESLAGRATRTRLLPFSLDEVSLESLGKPAIVRDRLREEEFALHLVVGGYPAVWLSQTPEVLLADLLEAVVLRDASDLFRIGRPDAFRQLLHLLAGQSGQLVNLSEWASVLGINRDTVAS
jgi:predicted AAA+ superfamily ATPase